MKARSPSPEDIEPEEKRAIEPAPGGRFYLIGREEVVDSVAEKQFLAKDMLIAVEDRLLGDKAKVLDLRRAFRLSLSRRVHQ